MMDVETLIACGIAPTQAKAFLKTLADACAVYSINTATRMAAFVAQCAHESQNFTMLEECLYYRTPERVREVYKSTVHSLDQAAGLCRAPEKLANVVYANRNGNGDVASGDGWKYRGRGLIHLTGRANYAKASVNPGANYETHPEIVSTPSHACLTAAWFWATNGCNVLADASNIDAITRVINGEAMAGKNERRENFREALVAFRK